MTISQKRKSITVISLSRIASDGRVLRQIEYLSQAYDLLVIGYGAPPPHLASHPRIRWHQLRLPAHPVLRAFSAVSARLLQIPLLPRTHAAARLAVRFPSHAYLANNWDALPAAALAAQAHQARLVLDIHESFDSWYWGLSSRLIRRVLKKYAPQVHASTTVVQPLAEQHRQFGLSPLVLRNIPSLPQTPATLKKTDPQMIRLVHHGVAAPARRTDLMIRTLALCDPRYQLHLILTNHNSRYVKKLRRLAHKLAPGRVFFYPPLPAMQIVAGLSSYDVGFYPLVPTSYNNLIALPNKLFEFIAAGLAVCIGPSPSMAEVVRQHGCGLVAPSFQPQDLADLLNRTAPAQWDQIKRASKTAARQLNADHEMRKLLDIFSGLLH